jgi:hypothetical protein
MLLSSISSSLELRSGFWTAQLAIAALTAHLRVRAGLHYPSDVLVGSLVGAAIGVALPLAHNVAVSLAPEEIVGMGVGVGLGTAVGYLFPKTAAETLAQYPLIVRPSGSGGYLMEVAGTFD